jgi:hypothetical protein
MFHTLTLFELELIHHHLIAAVIIWKVENPRQNARPVSTMGADALKEWKKRGKPAVDRHFITEPSCSDGKRPN